MFKNCHIIVNQTKRTCVWFWLKLDCQKREIIIDDRVPVPGHGRRGRQHGHVGHGGGLGMGSRLHSPFWRRSEEGDDLRRIRRIRLYRTSSPLASNSGQSNNSIQNSISNYSHQKRWENINSILSHLLWLVQTKGIKKPILQTPTPTHT